MDWADWRRPPGTNAHSNPATSGVRGDQRQEMRAVKLAPAARWAVLWHYHFEITDSFVGMEGQMIAETRAPRATDMLMLGERY